MRAVAHYLDVKEGKKPSNVPTQMCRIKLFR